MHLLYYKTEDGNVPKGNIVLCAGEYSVGVPKRARGSARGAGKHCLRIDGAYMRLAEGAWKYVLSDDDPETIRTWRVHLATRGGLGDDADADAESADVDAVRIVGAKSSTLAVQFRSTPLSQRSRTGSSMQIRVSRIGPEAGLPSAPPWARTSTTTAS